MDAISEHHIIVEQQLIQSECNRRSVAEANKAACTCKQWTRLRLLTRTVESAIFTLQSLAHRSWWCGPSVHVV